MDLKSIETMFDLKVVLSIRESEATYQGVQVTELIEKEDTPGMPKYYCEMKNIGALLN